MSKYLVSREVVGISGLLAPRALDRVAVDVRIVNSHDGVGGRLLRRKSGERKGQQIFLEKKSGTLQLPSRR